MNTRTRWLASAGALLGLVVAAALSAPANATTTSELTSSIAASGARSAALTVAPTPLATDYCDDEDPLLLQGSTSSALRMARVPSVSVGSAHDADYCILEEGLNNNTAVHYLQETLNHCYSAGLTVDGDFGPATYAAVLSMQSQIGVTVDGVYGHQTREAMKWWNYYTSAGGCYKLAAGE